MHLGHQRRALAAREPFDDRQLPERARAVQAPRELLADQLGELVRAAGGGQRGAVHVPAEVELLVVDPHRVGHSARGRLQALAVARDEVQALLDALEDAGVLQAGAGLEDEHAADRHRHRPLLGGQGGAVGGRQRLGHGPEGSRATRRLHSHEGTVAPARARRGRRAGRARGGG